MSTPTDPLLVLQLLLLLATGTGQPGRPPAPSSPDAWICIAPFNVTKDHGNRESNMSPTTWAPTARSRFEFRIDGQLKATVANGEMASITGLSDRVRVKVSLDGRPFETLSLNFRDKPQHRICLWLYPGYWHWIDNGWTSKLGCRCNPTTAPRNDSLPEL